MASSEPWPPRPARPNLDVSSHQPAHAAVAELAADLAALAARAAECFDGLVAEAEAVTGRVKATTARLAAASDAARPLALQLKVSTSPAGGASEPVEPALFWDPPPRRARRPPADGDGSAAHSLFAGPGSLPASWRAAWAACDPPPDLLGSRRRDCHVTY